MNLESQEETGSDGPEKPGVGVWQKVALVIALISTLAGLALGGFDAEPEGVSAASPQAQSFAAGGAPQGEAVEAEGAEEGPGLWAPLLAKGGLSFFLAFCVGYAVRAALKMLFLAVGLAALAVFGLQYAGLLGDVEWERLSEFWEVGVTAAKGQMEGLQAFITGSLPSAASASLGAFTGFRRTS